VTTRTVTLHAPEDCAAGLANLGADADGSYRALGDFDAPAPTDAHALMTAGIALPELDTQARALLVDATEATRAWTGTSAVAPSGGVDLLLLPSMTSCALHGTVAPRAAAAMGAVGDRVLVVGTDAGAAATAVFRLDTGAVGAASPELATMRNAATVTAFGTGGLVAGGSDARSGAALASAEVYDPSTGGFDAAPIALRAARTHAGAAVMATGETILVGGLGPSGTPLASLEIVDPATRTSRAAAATLAVPRKDPAVLRLASGEILVAGGLDASGNPATTLEWFAPDGSRASQRTEELVAGSARSYIALQAGGALAVIAPPLVNPPTPFQNTWIIDPDGVLEPAAVITGALTEPMLFGGAGDAPVLWTGAGWLQWQPWSGSFGTFATMDTAPPRLGPATATIATSADPGLALWLDPSASKLTGLRFDVRGRYSPLAGALLADGTDDTSPDHLASDGSIAFSGGSLSLDPGASVFVTDRTYADVRVAVDAPTGAPAILVLRDDQGNELEVGGASCPGAIVTGSPLTLTVERHGTNVTWSVTSTAPSNACIAPFAAGARVSIGVRGAPDLTRSVARNLRIDRLGSP
jgi:hypothetical protein